METELQYFLLILVRIASFLWISPGFSNRQIPNLAKLVFSSGLAFAVYGTTEIPVETLTIGLFTVLVLKEVLLGVAIGYITQLFFSAVEMAGSFVDFQVGFSMSMAFDPALGVNASYYGQLYYWIALVIFFVADVHHHVIRTLVNSFQYVPITQLDFPYMGIEGIVQIFVHVIEIALNLAFPMMIIALLSEIVLALLSRTVPQINVLILGMPMKILLSLVFMFIFLPVLYENITDLFPEMLRTLQEFIQSIST